MNSDDFLPHMRDVARCEESLRELNLMWRVIEATAKMNCPDEAQSLLPMMAATREGFQRLEKELVASLVHQKVANVMSEVGTKAQHVIDIIVRNLYERTADVGFLATDRELCEYLAGLRDDRGAAVERLRAYRDKYTVYDEIVLLDTRGGVVAHIDADSPIEGSTDPLIAQTLQCDTFVETFRGTDLRPGRGPALVYSQRMLHPHSGQPIGVLCLVFGFETEMASIFASRQAKDGRSITLLLDAHSRVIASADESWVARGATVPVSRAQPAQLCAYGGREYLVQTAVSAGYQGYPGPRGWQAQVMVPVDVAFSGRAGGVLDSLDDAVVQGLLTHADSYCPPLQEIVSAAETIRRVVWNGQVMTAGEGLDLRKLKTVLEQITETGARSNEVFMRSIGDLYDTVLASNCASAEFTTQLLVELLDRNLYERSDDCRWWAMTPELRSTLAQPDPSAEALAAVGEILHHINSLYTVYTRLVVYDRTGRIIAASNPVDADGSTLLGACIEGDTLEAVCALRSTQDYHVTPFRASALYGGRPTYVYHAAIRALDDEAKVVGGIGIVFDSQIEFAAMLGGGLSEQPDCTALFVDREGRVVSSTSEAHPVGSVLSMPADLLALDNGHSASRVVVRDGSYTVLACAVSHGYREFKIVDGYRDDVIAVFLRSLGAVVEVAHGRAEPVLDAAAIAGAAEFATFVVDGGLFALPAARVVEALPASAVRPVSLGGSALRVGALARHREGRVQGYVWVFDLRALLGGAPASRRDQGHVVVFRYQGAEFGLLVGDLHGVPAFAAEQIVPPPSFAGDRNLLVSHLIRANAGRLLIQVIDPRRLFARLTAQTEAGLASDEDETAGGEAAHRSDAVAVL